MPEPDDRSDAEPLPDGGRAPGSPPRGREARREKLARLRAAGIDAYPVGFTRSHTLPEVRAGWERLDPGEESADVVRVAGRIVRRRGLGRLAFWTLRQGGDELQVMLAADELGDEQFTVVGDLDVGDWVGVQGVVVRTRRGELSVRAAEVYLLAKSLEPLPDKWHGLTDVEVRSRRRELDLIVNPAARGALRLRHEVIQTLRREMLARDYVEVGTPILQPVPGGALARPFVTHHNALDTDLYLRVAGELYLKRLLVGGIERVFELGRMFRNEGIDARHNPEFTMLESNEAFADYRDMMRLARELVLAAADAAGVGRELDQGPHRIDLGAEWRELPLLDAVRAAIGEPGLGYDWPLDELRKLCDRLRVGWMPGWGPGKLVLELYEKHAEHRLIQPTFVTAYPAEVSPLAHPHRDDPAVTERFELIIGGREYANAFSELTDPGEQRRRLEEQALARAGGDEEAMVVDQAYLRALELGLPPNAGLGLGVDRLVMLLGGLSSIREALPFPQLRPDEG
ncbi:MAG TPA: lysine--tRNA ligase [Actinomycetes bacterium]|nr:lysine--tRNA ligase [Actinomycetes bacterium]